MNNLTLTLRSHILPGKTVIEARDREGALVCTVTQGDEDDTIRILSKHDWKFTQTCDDPPKIMEVEILR